MYQDIIKEICDEKDISYKLISNNYLIMLQKDNKTKFIWGHKFDLNNHAIGLVLDDKYATYDMLKNNDIPVIEHSIIYKNDSKIKYAKNLNTKKYYYDLFLKYNKNIVLKINNGSCGNGVYHIKSFNKFIAISNKLFKKHISLSVSPFVKIDCEYRIIVLKKRVMLIYGKKPPVVIGDGKTSLKDLLLEFNYNYFKNKKVKNYVPKKGEFYNYSFKFNLSKGAIVTEVKDEKEKLLEIVNDIINKLDINFCSIDIVKTENTFKVLEINSGVMINKYIKLVPNGRNIAKEIYKCAIMEMFK